MQLTEESDFKKAMNQFRLTPLCMKFGYLSGRINIDKIKDQTIRETLIQKREDLNFQADQLLNGDGTTENVARYKELIKEMRALKWEVEQHLKA